MAQTNTLLYIDAVDHLRYNYMGGDVDAELRDIREAIQTAYREVAWDHPWRYYRTIGRVILNPSYSTGTISSSGTTVTLTSGTWSATIVTQYSMLLVGSVAYPISKYTDSTHLELESAPGTAFSGDSYTIYQDRYPLPSDWRCMHTPQPEAGSFGLSYVTTDDFLAVYRNNITSGQSRLWTLLADQDFPGGMCIAVHPYPTAATTLDFLYVRTPRALRRTGYETASRTGTFTNSGVTCTFTSANITSDMVGSFLRTNASGVSTCPTGLSGLIPYADQGRIFSVTNTTVLTTYPALGATYTASGFVISDPLDMSTGMITAFYRRAEAELAIARGKDIGGAMNLYQRALSDARDRDAGSMEAYRAGEPASWAAWDAYSVTPTPAATQ